MQIHDAVCQKLGVDDISFQYQATPSDDELDDGPRGQSRGFGIEFKRDQGQGEFAVRIDNSNIEHPVRFLCQYTWPPSREHAFQDIDLAAEGVFETLGQNWQRVLAEVRIRGQVDARGESATGYLAEKVLGFAKSDLSGLDAPPSFVSVGYETPAQDPGPQNHLDSPKREVTVEVLREDPRSLYVEVVSQWPQLAGASKGKIRIDSQRIRQFSAEPSEYIENSMAYINEVVLLLFSK